MKDFSSGRRDLWIMITWTIVAMGAQVLLLIFGAEGDLGGVFNAKFRWDGLATAYGLWAESAWFMVALIGLHLAFVKACLVAYRACVSRTYTHDMRLTIGYLLLATLAALLLNSWLYPQSRTGFIFSLALINPSARYVMYLLVACVGITWAFALCRALVSSRIVRIVILLAVVAIAYWKWTGTVTRSEFDVDQPNIIILGVDSLRGDVLGESGLGLTRNIDAVLEGGVIFDNAITSLGRTFPAMMTMLTGEWPINHGARDNLYPLDQVHAERSIAWSLREAGYQTTIFTDESRFANIDGSYGFEHAVVPGYGLLDFAMSAVGDWFLLNLVSSTPMGRLLFPYCYGNRAVEHLYTAGAFYSRVAHALHDLDPARPAYLHFHLETPHWPYRSRSPYDENDTYAALVQGRWVGMNPNYFRAVDQADQQIGTIVDMLERRGLLRNAIVIVLSDHGEGFVLPKDQWVARDGSGGSLDSYGHGTNATSLPQNRVVFGWKRYGANAWPARNTSAPVSLVDMAPTIAELTGIQLRGPADGLSLVAELQGKSEIDMNRSRFVESGLWPAGLQNTNIDPAKVLAQGATYYQSNAAGRVVFRDDRMADALAAKQRAVHQGPWIFANAVASPSRFIVARMNSFDGSGEWWNEGDVPADAPVAELQRVFCEHWAADGDSVLLPGCH